MLPKILKQDIRLRALSLLTTQEMDELRLAINGLHILDIDNVHESYLPWLSWWFRVDTWDDAWTVEKKRDVVKEGLVLYRYKGTVWAVERALDLTGFNPTLTVWHQMNPLGAKGTFLVEVIQDKGGLTQKDYENLVRLVESNKQGSQHWNMTIKNNLPVGGIFNVAVLKGRSRILSKNFPSNPKLTGELYSAVSSKSRHRTTIRNKSIEI